MAAQGEAAAAATTMRAGASSVGAWFTQVGQMVILTTRTIVSAVRPPYPYGDELVWQFVFVLKLSWFPLIVTTFALCLGAPGLQSAGILSLLGSLDRLGGFFATLFSNATVTDLWASVMQCTLFGAIISIVCCFKGMTASGGAEGVGRAVNQAVVISFVSVFFFQFAVSSILLATNPELQAVR